MAKRKIVILGGGMAGLSAAYQLTRTAALRAENNVTVYQMGWRLGGKAASGRDSQGRNLEHGLHVWFGCYENTFQMIQEVYAARQPAGGWAMETWRDAVKPQNFTPIGVQDAAGNWSYWPLIWATNKAVPGDGTLLPTIWEVIETIVDWIYLIMTHADEPTAAAAIAAAGPPLAHTPVEPRPSAALAAAGALIHELGQLLATPEESELNRVLDLIGWAHDAHAGTLAAGPSVTIAHTIQHEILNIFLAMVKGVSWDLILHDAPLISIDDIEFRAWLIKHGADPVVVAKSSLIRVVYDTLFQYAEGDAACPDLAAGTGLGAVMRLVGTYKGSMMWEVQAGMGEVIVGPLYEHLLNAGVTFKFFHKVTSIEPDTSNPNDPHPPVGTIRFALQAETVSGDYVPVTNESGMILWPSQPYWQQLKDGAAMQQAGINFESNWCQWPPVGPPVVLTAGKDFDVVVLAIALGAFKPLNSADTSICQPLIDKSPAFAAWADNVGIVPSMAVQLWCNPATSLLGWTGGKAATVSGPEYLNIWADMTQVLAFEPWAQPAPKSLHYLTGTFKTTLYKQPSSNAATPAEGLANIRAQTISWLNGSSMAIWPLARADGHFDWNVLKAAPGIIGEARLDAQFLRANIDPTECTTLSGTGTTRYRLHAGESGFPNLILAGEGTAMGLTTSFEGAVMSGAAASRAICGQPAIIVGYDFLERRPSQGPGK